MVDQLIDGQEQEIPSRENAHGNEPAQGQTGRHSHLHLLSDRKLDQAIGGHILERVAHRRSSNRHRLSEKNRPRVLRQKIHRPLKFIKIFHVSP